MAAAAKPGDAALLRGMVLGVFVPAAVCGLIAAMELRPLYADGFHYLIRILETEFPTMPSPGRRFTEWAMQVPLLLAIKLGVTDIGDLAQIFSLSLQLTPVALTALCWPMLPAGRKPLMMFPVVHYVAGICTATFGAIAAGPAASAAFWLMLFYILFRMRGSRSIDIALVLAPCAFVLHESIVFLGPLLALAAYIRARKMTHRGDRIVSWLLAATFLAAAALQGYFIARPAHAGHGASQLEGLLKGYWLVGQHGTVNLPAVVGVAGLIVLAALWLADRREMRSVGRTTVAVFCVASLAAAAWLYASGRVFAPDAHMTARNNSALISLPLGIAAIAVASTPLQMGAAFLRQSAAVVGIMAAIALSWDLYATRQWSHYIAVFRGLLAENRGFVEWEVALDRMSDGDRRLFVSLTHLWTIPQISIALAPNGHVTTLLASNRPAPWRLYDPRNISALPRSRFWNFREYEAAVTEPPVDENPR